MKIPIKLNPTYDSATGLQPRHVEQPPRRHEAQGRQVQAHQQGQVTQPRGAARKAQGPNSTE